MTITNADDLNGLRDVMSMMERSAARREHDIAGRLRALLDSLSISRGSATPDVRGATEAVTGGDIDVVRAIGRADPAGHRAFLITADFLDELRKEYIDG